MTQFIRGRIVSNTGPLISLEKLSDGFRFIERLHEKILVPRIVLQELAQGRGLTEEEYLSQHNLGSLLVIHDGVDINPAVEGLMDLAGAEAQAISLARETGLPLLIEERDGRRVAIAAGLAISGIAGEVLAAAHLSLIAVQEGKDMLKQLFLANRINKSLYNRLLIALEDNE